MENLQKFLDGLTRLTRETGIRVNGCGCDASPFLEEVSAVTAAEREYVYSEEAQKSLGPESALDFKIKSPRGEMVNTGDLKSPDASRTGSSPVGGT